MNHLRLVPVVCLAALLGACGGGGGGGAASSAPAASPPVQTAANVTNTLSGKVLDKAGNGVAGVTISVFHHNNNTSVTTTTDANGAYAVAGQSTVANADYAIYAAKAGYGFLPSVADPAGAVGKLDFFGLYRTVIRFLVMPAHNVTSANFTALAAGDRVVTLARTGQSASYASGDDAAAQGGVAWPAVRFTDNADGTVTDNLTGMVWLKSAGSLAPTTWAAALAAANQLASGACGLSDGSAAGKWRMPNVNELESLVDVSRSSPAISAGHPFTNISLTAAYWSSTTYTALTANAMAIRMSDGRWINGIDAADGSYNNNKLTSSNALWAVKSGAAGKVQLLATGVFNSQGGGSFGAADDAFLQLGAAQPGTRFVDKGDGTIADTATGLTWLKQADCIKLSWAEAIASINILASGRCGLTDGSSAGQWRMPNRSEMLSLSDRAPTFPQASYLIGQYMGTSAVTGPIIFGNFIVGDYYWTSTTDAADPTHAWTLYSCDFGVYNIAKTDVRYAWGVRCAAIARLASVMQVGTCRLLRGEFGMQGFRGHGSVVIGLETGDFSVAYSENVDPGTVVAAAGVLGHPGRVAADHHLVVLGDHIPGVEVDRLHRGVELAEKLHDVGLAVEAA